MDPFIGDWLNLALRWAHVITGIAWIGSSFYFNWLDSQLETPDEPREGVEGELWMVHSGGFYRVEKIDLAPAELPRTLHWFKWEAGFTWITGFLLLGLIYYLGAEVYLLDPGVSEIGAGGAIALGLAVLVISWLIYDLMWASPFGRNETAATVVSFMLLIALAYGLGEVLSARAAYLHVGAVLGTLMAANVWMRIIPAQTQLVTATKEGTRPDAKLAANAKQRSVHNNYMTLPVIFVMLSGHYPGTYGHAYGWLILIVLFLAGAGVRHWFNLRNKGKSNYWIVPASVAAVIVLMVATAPRTGPEATADAGEPVTFAEVEAVMTTRCMSCHSESPTDENFDAAPKNVKFDTPEQIRALRTKILISAVNSDTMPLGNTTEMTEEERAMLGRWIRQGASID
jgi:uncharacterized membrane protein